MRRRIGYCTRQPSWRWSSPGVTWTSGTRSLCQYSKQPPCWQPSGVAKRAVRHASKPKIISGCLLACLASCLPAFFVQLPFTKSAVIGMGGGRARLLCNAGCVDGDTGVDWLIWCAVSSAGGNPQGARRQWVHTDVELVAAFGCGKKISV
jgi:hypothetical protein